MSPKTLRALALALVGVFALASTAVAQTPKTTTPTGEAILAKYTKVSGGIDAIKKVSSMKMTGNVKIQQLGDVPFESISKEMTVDAGTKTERKVWAYKETVDLGEQYGKMVTGSDSLYCWESSIITGSRLIEGDEKAIALRDHNPRTYLNWKVSYKSVKNLGAENVGKIACWKVQLTPKVGAAETHWFDQATGFMVQTTMKRTQLTGELEITATYDDVRLIPGTSLKLPHKTKIDVKGMGEQSIVLNEIKLNPELADTKFAAPKPIVKLIKKAEAKKKPAPKPIKPDPNAP